MRLLYQDRKERFYQLVSELLSGHLTLYPTETGLHTVAWLSESINDQAFSNQMTREGIYAPALSSYTIEHMRKPGLVLGYGAYTEQQTTAAIRKMARLIG